MALGDTADVFLPIVRFPREEAKYLLNKMIKQNELIFDRKKQKKSYGRLFESSPKPELVQKAYAALGYETISILKKQR